jgi:hydrogenase-4 component E
MHFIDQQTLVRSVDILATGILVTAFLIISSKSLTFYVRLFALQSILLGTLSLLIAVRYGEAHILTATVLTFVVKGITIPLVLNKVIDRIRVRKELDFSINITVSLIICGAIVILSNSVAQPILQVQRAGSLFTTKVLPISIAVMLIGLFIMISRKKAVTQIIGLLTMENGLFLCGLSITHGMPLIVEVGIFFDILVAALILGLFVFRINKSFETIDIAAMRSLKH